MEGRKIPGGTVVKLTVMSETGEVQEVSGTLSAPNAEGVSTAAVNVTFEHGFTRVFVQASLEPSP